MEDSRKVIRNIMIGIVLTAVVMGLMYYYHETQDESMSGKGTLIAANEIGWLELWQQ